MVVRTLTLGLCSARDDLPMTIPPPQTDEEVLVSADPLSALPSDSPEVPRASDDPAPASKQRRGLDLWQAAVSPLEVLLLVLVVFGVYLRLQNFGFPGNFQFDEHHFVETARGYLKHLPDGNDHPPLGKLLIAAGVTYFGDTPVGFRLPSLISGFLTILLGAFAARRLFPQRSAILLAAAFLSADGFLIAYSRAGLLDGFLALASVAGVLLITFDISLFWGCLAGLVLGFAASVKFSGIGVLLPLLFCLGTAKQGWRTKLLALLAAGVVASTVYLATYAFGLSMANKAHAPLDVIADTLRLLRHHAELTDMKNPATSGWITWFLPTRPLMLGFVEKHAGVRALTSLGNLAIWWGATVLAAGSVGVILRLGWSNVLAKQGNKEESSPITLFVVEQGQAVVGLLLAALGFLLPWMLSHRDSYAYHYLPAYAPLVLLLCGFLAWYEARRPARVLGYVVAVLLVAAFYGPIWAYIPVSHEAMNLRLFMGSWR